MLSLLWIWMTLFHIWGLSLVDCYLTPPDRLS
jgi:hypothetical protein